MELIWKITPSDAERIRRFVSEHEGDPLVKERARRNLASNKPNFDRSEFWRALLNCLLTTQQKSGPDRPVFRFMRTKPFPLAYKHLANAPRVASFATDVLSKFGGIRRSKTIGKQIAANVAVLENGLWSEILKQLDSLRGNADQAQERAVARFLSDRLDGIGPKQSRNLLQMLGLTRFEIPIDSRVTKWLNDFGFPLRLSANALSDPNYYDFVSAGIQQLCNAAGVFPCLLDATIFSVADKGRWQSEHFQELW